MPRAADNAAKAAESKPIDLSKKETALLAAFVEYNMEQVKIDWEKVAERTGYNSSKNAISAFARLKKKIYDPPSPTTMAEVKKPGPKGSQANKSAPNAQKKAAEPTKPATKARAAGKLKRKPANAPSPPTKDFSSDDEDQESDEAEDEDEDDDENASVDCEVADQKRYAPIKSSAYQTSASKFAADIETAKAASPNQKIVPKNAGHEPKGSKPKAKPANVDTDDKAITKKPSATSPNSPKKKSDSFVGSVFTAQNSGESQITGEAFSEPQLSSKPQQATSQKPSSLTSSGKGPSRGFHIAVDDDAEEPRENPFEKSQARTIEQAELSAGEPPNINIIMDRPSGPFYDYSDEEDDDDDGGVPLANDENASHFDQVAEEGQISEIE